MQIENALLRVVVYGGICACALAAGGVAAAFRPPSDRLRSHIQHVAAGLVFAAACVEVLPDVMHRHLPLAAAAGFVAGVALMLTIRAFSEMSDRATGGGQWSLLAVVAVDIFVDGLLIGVSSVTARGEGQQALLVTVALAVELLSLGLSVAASLGQHGIARLRSIAVTSGVALIPLAGAIAGHFLGDALSGAWIEGVLAFAVAALLYLAAEELLREAHEVPETLLSTALFFVAFLALMLIDMATS